MRVIIQVQTRKAASTLQLTALEPWASAEASKIMAFDQTQAELLPQSVSAEVRLVEREKEYLRSRLPTSTL